MSIDSFLTGSSFVSSSFFSKLYLNSFDVLSSPELCACYFSDFCNDSSGACCSLWYEGFSFSGASSGPSSLTWASSKLLVSFISTLLSVSRGASSVSYYGIFDFRSPSRKFWLNVATWLTRVKALYEECMLAPWAIWDFEPTSGETSIETTGFFRTACSIGERFWESLPVMFG